MSTKRRHRGPATRNASHVYEVPIHLAEFGIIARIGRNGVEVLLAVIAKRDEGGIVPAEARSRRVALAEQFDLVKRHILEMARRVLAWHRASSLSRALEAIPGHSLDEGWLLS